jgi:Zn-dependent M28 family amino/carboxypeptidase
MADWIGELYRSDLGWNHIQDLVDIPGNGRLAGTDTERRAADVTQKKFEKIGLRNVHREEFEMQGWQRKSSEIRHPESETVQDCFALHRNPVGTVRGKLIDLGHGLPENFDELDVDGKVVLLTNGQPDWYPRTVPRMEKYHLAIDAGAVGVIVQNHQKGLLARSGTVRARNGDPIGEIPCVGVTYEVGSRLSRRFSDSLIEMEIDAEIFDTTSQNIIGEIGPPTEEHIIVSCHIDSADISEDTAGDNAAGVGLVVELANALLKREEELETRVRFIGFGDEVPELGGSAYHASQIDLDDVKAVLQNDGIVRGPNLRAHTNGFRELETVAESVAADLGHPITTTREIRLSSDQWNFVKEGVPGYQFASERRDGTPMHGLNSRIVLTAWDTFDKLDKRDLRDHAIWETELITKISQSDFSITQRSADEISEQLVREGKDFKKRTFPVV